jgi:hypothetical protein
MVAGSCTTGVPSFDGAGDGAGDVAVAAIAGVGAAGAFGLDGGGVFR